MEHKLKDSSNGNCFFRNIEKRFDLFKNKMKILCSEKHIVFDEDVFMDTIIRCSKTFRKEGVTNIDVDKYFWKSYKHNCYSKKSRDKFSDVVEIDDIVDVDEIEFDRDYDDVNNSYYSEVIDRIKSSIKKHFGERIYNAWILHVCDDYTYEHLNMCGYKDINLHNEFKKVKIYIRNFFEKCFSCGNE